MTTYAGVEEAHKSAKGAFVRRRYRVLNDEAAPHSFYAGHFAWGPFGTVIAHLAFVLILMALVVSTYTSFEQNVNIGVGDKAGASTNCCGMTAIASTKCHSESPRGSKSLTRAEKHSLPGQYHCGGNLPTKPTVLVKLPRQRQAKKT